VPHASGITASRQQEIRVPSELSIIEGQYLKDILAQPRALDDTLENLENGKALQGLAARIRGGRFKNIVLTGMGSSFHALHPLQNELIKLGLATTMVETSELVYYKSRLFDSKNILIAVSQSGQSVEMVRLLKMNRGKAPLIAVTNTKDSPLANYADAQLVTRAGSEFSVSCKTYVSALMALQWLAQVIASRDLRRSRKELQPASRFVSEYLLHWRAYTEELAALLKPSLNLFYVGRGNSLAAVGTAALTTKESSHFAAEGLSSAAFRHGPLEMLCPQTFVFVFGGDRRTRELNASLLKDIRAHGGKAELIIEHSRCRACALPAAPPALSPILEILPVQMITLALAALSGREAGRFDFATKITTKE
jgi:glutamine---fructose-6-phosphate transaminase (isomerizing)